MSTYPEIPYAPYGQPYFETLGREPGLNRPANNPCRIIDFAVLRLRAGETHEFDTGDREFALDPLTGTIDVTVGSDSFPGIGGRKSVFDGPPHVVYVGCGSRVRILARDDAEVGLGSCPSSTPIEPYHVKPEEVFTGQWGDGNTTRHFRAMINKNRPSERLWFAEVMVADGRWATYPPHKHENVPGEVFQEEMYYYRVEPAHGFGFCGQFEGQVGGDYAFLIRDNTLHKMPNGYHTVAAAPGYRVWYLATYAGPTGKAHSPVPHPHHAKFRENQFPANPV
jgi:Uncharacterized enzyme involved in inositol metabolism